jgi:alpha-beta hydrolase superfamily lysophospholipase
VFSLEKLTADYIFDFLGNFEKVSLETEDRITSNNLLFKADNSKGIILYLHAKANSLVRYGKYAKFYTDLGYDIFMTDYRGYGKSERSVSSENQAHQYNQMLYDELKKNPFRR